MIFHHKEDVSFSPKNKISIRNWISDVIVAEGKKVGEINYIYCSDEYLLELNKSSLNHDYYTDIITFDYVEDNVIVGDLFISIDRVKDNAKTNNVSFDNELYRVMVHGVLHLCGYGDKKPKEEQLMRQKEDFYIKKILTN